MTPDSGTTFMTMPQWALDIFIEETFEPNMICERDLSDLGVVTFVIGGVDYDLEPHHWVRWKFDDDSPTGGRCENMFRGQDISIGNHENLFAIGDIFMQLYFTVFDRDYDRIGFATAVHQTNEVMIQYDMEGAFRETVTYEWEQP